MDLDNFLVRFVAAGIAVICLVMMASGIPFFIQALGDEVSEHRQPTATKTPADDGTQTATWPPDGMTAFSVTAGPAAPSDWSGPYRVEIATPTVAEWRSGFVATVYEAQAFVVDLENDRHYEIVVEAANGQRRSVGTFQAGELREPVDVVAFPCCVDDFGTPAPTAQEAESR